MKLKRLLLSMMLLSVAIVSSYAYSAVKKGETYPSVKIANIKGSKKLSKETLKGKITIINFWATWCASCKVELKEMASKFKSLESNKNFQFALVSVDQDPKKAHDWLTKNKGLLGRDLTPKLFVDPKFELTEELEIDQWPYTIIVNEQGKVIYSHGGYKKGNGAVDKMKKIAKGQL